MPICLLYCEGCQTRHPKDLEGPNFQHFLQAGVHEAYCEQCRQTTPWVLVLPTHRMAASGNAAAPYRILAIDDDEDVLRVVKLQLEREGHVVSVANSANKAIEMLQTQQYDVIVADILMPGFDGKSLLRFMAVLLPYCVPKLVFLTGDKSDETRRFLLESRRPYLFKPFGVSQLLSLIRQVG